MNATTETGRKHDLDAGRKTKHSVNQRAKLQEYLSTLHTDLKRREVVSPIENLLQPVKVKLTRRRKRTDNDKGRLCTNKKVLGENMQDNKVPSKQINSKKKTANDVAGNNKLKVKKNRSEHKINGQRNLTKSGAGEEEGGLVYYKKKKLITPPPHDMNEIEEFIPTKRRKKNETGYGDEAGVNLSVKYIYEKKKKGKTREADGHVSNDPVRSSVKLKKKKKDLDLRKSVIEEEPITKKRGKHKECIITLDSDSDNRLLETGKDENGKKKKRKKTIQKLNTEDTSHPETIDISKNSNNKKKTKRRPDEDEVIEDFVAHIALNQSLIGDPEKKREAEQTYRDCTIQNYESSQILEVEKTITELAKTGRRDKGMNKSLSEKSYHELDSMMDEWFSKDLKSKKDRRRRRKSLELPREVPQSIGDSNNKRHSIENPSNTTWTPGSTNDCPSVVKRGKVRKIAEYKLSSPRRVVDGKIIERTNVGDNQNASTSQKKPVEKKATSLKKSNNEKAEERNTDKQQNGHSDSDGLHESEESLNKLIQELKEKLGLEELFRLLKKQRRVKNRSKATTKKSTENLANGKNKRKQKDASSTEGEEGISVSTKNKLNTLRNEMNEDFERLIETTKRTEDNRGNLGADLSVSVSNDVNGIIYSPETLIKEPLMTDTEETYHHGDDNNPVDGLFKQETTSTVTEGINYSSEIPPDIKEPLTIDIEEVNCLCDSDSGESWMSLPVHIKHSPISIKDEDLSNVSENADIDCNRTPQQHQLKQEDEILVVEEIKLEPDAVESNPCEIPVISSERNEDDGNNHIVEMRDDLTPRQQQMLRNLEVKLPFEPPTSHEVQSKAMSWATKEDKEKLKLLGIKIKKGRFSMEEDALIRRNWLDFIKEHGIPNDPLPFMYLRDTLSNTRFLSSQSNFRKFVQYLARDLNDRMLNSVHARFKMLFTKLNKGRFTDEENNTILRLLEVYKHKKNVYSIIAHKLQRTRFSIQQHCEGLQLRSELGQGYSTLSNETIVAGIMEVLKYDNVEQLKNKKLSRSTYKVIAKKLNILPSNLKLRWLSTIYPALFSKIRDTNEVRRRFINLLIESQVTDVRKIKYSHYARKYFQGCTGYELSQILRPVMKLVPKGYNFRESLLYLQQNVIDNLPVVPFTTINLPKR